MYIMIIGWMEISYMGHYQYLQPMESNIMVICALESNIHTQKPVAITVHIRMLAEGIF